MTLHSIHSKLDNIWGKSSLLQKKTRPAKPPIENLVLEGGGIKGLVYAGALEALEDNNILAGIERVAGSSAGGIVALMLCVGYSAKEIRDIMISEIDFKELMDSRIKFDPTRHFGAHGLKVGIGDLGYLFTHKGLYKGDKFKVLAKKIIARKIKEKLKSIALTEAEFDVLLAKYDLDNIENITFHQLHRLKSDFPQLGFKDLYVTGTKVKDASLKVFSQETDPHMPIVEAVRITMSFPFGFEPVYYQGEYYADGGIANNYPMSIFDDNKFLSHGLNEAGANPCTLGLLVDSAAEINQRWGVKQEKSLKEKLSLSRLFKGVIKGLHTRIFVLKEKYDINSVQIFDENVDVMDLNITEEQKNKLVFQGKNALQSYCDLYLHDHQYSHLPDYINLEEKYYAQSPEVLTKIIETDLWPLIQEVHTLKKMLKGLRLSEYESHLNKALNAFDPSIISDQVNACQEIINVTAYLNSFEASRVQIESLIAKTERQNRSLWREIDALTEKDKTHENVSQYYARQKTLSASLASLRQQLDQCDENLSCCYKDLLAAQEKIVQPVFDLIDERSKLDYIVENKIIEKLEETEELLHQQLDVAIHALSRVKRTYKDPRLSDQLQIDIEEIKLNEIAFLEKMYLEEYDHNTARSKAMIHYDLIESLMQFGLSLHEAKKRAAIFFLPWPDSEQSKKLKEKKLFELLMRKSMPAGSAYPGYVLKAYRSALALYAGKPSGYAEFLAKQEVLALWKQGIYRYTPKIRTEAVQYKYAFNLSQLAAKLGVGEWAGEVSLENLEDVQHNLHYNFMISGESYNKHLSDYILKTSAYSYSDADHDPAKTHPPIVAHILRPSKAFANNPKKLVKEIIIAFQAPNVLEEAVFSVISKNNKNREKHFKACQERLVDQLKSAIIQMQAQGLQPPEARVHITLSGEGLAGQDAQYLFSALIEAMRLHPSDKTFSLISKIDLSLVDPARVSLALSEKTARSLSELKRKNKSLTISSYTVIHQSGLGVHGLSKKPQNYLGEAHVLSHCSEKDGEVVAEYRDSTVPEKVYKRLFNKKNSSLLLKKALNEKNVFTESRTYRALNFYFYKSKRISKTILLESFPKLVSFFGASSSAVAKSCFRMMSNVFSLSVSMLQKATQKRKNPPLLNWSQSVENSDKDKEIGRKYAPPYSLQQTLQDYVVKTDEVQRLKAQTRPPVENLVLEGGGIKVFAFLGALDVMRKKDMLKNLKRVAGSSTGGWLASLIAIGFTEDELIKVFTKEIDLKSLLDQPIFQSRLFKVNDIEFGIPSLMMLFKRKGLFKGDVLKRVSENLVNKKLSENIKKSLFKILPADEKNALFTEPPGLTEKERDHRIDDYLNLKLKTLLGAFGIATLSKITFSQLKTLGVWMPELNIKDLYLTGTRLSDGAGVVFCAETEPDMPIVEAVRITMSFPGGFIPIKYKGEYYADGGIANNYPMQIFDQGQFLSHGLNESRVNPCTLGLLVDSPEEIDSRWGVDRSRIKGRELPLIQFAQLVLDKTHKRIELIQKKYQINSIQISDAVQDVSVRALEIELSSEKRHELINNGKKVLEDYYDNYVQGAEYSHYQHYDNMMQKYFPKEPVELLRILKEEIDPLLSECETLRQRLKEAPNPEWLERLQKSEKAIEYEKQIVIRTLQSKGEVYPPPKPKDKPAHLSFVLPESKPAPKAANKSKRKPKPKRRSKFTPDSDPKIL